MTIFSTSINLDYILNLLFILIFVILFSSIILLMASRSTDKILKGLQGTASATVIARGAIDAYKSWENSNPEDEDENKKDDNKDGNKKDTNKDELKNDENKDDNKDKTNEK